MNFLLDTNVVSEYARPRPDPGVVAFLSSQNEDSQYLSVATVAELHGGVERMPAGATRDRLALWLSDGLLKRFDRRLVGIDAEIANTWGRLVIQAERAGRPMDVMDGWIAAAAAKNTRPRPQKSRSA